MTTKLPRGLDGRTRDQNPPKAGEIREKRCDTLFATLRREYGAGFAPGVRSDMRLDTLRERTGKSLHQLVRRRLQRLKPPAENCGNDWQSHRLLSLSPEGVNAMTTISEKTTLLTFINVFTVRPENQDLLVELLTQATDVSVRYAKGFVSSALHRSLDGTKVTMYAQWQSMEAYQAMRGDPAASPYLTKALTIATFEAGAYEVIKTFASALPHGAP